jgi:hypothetical protein
MRKHCNVLSGRNIRAASLKGGTVLIVRYLRRYLAMSV